MLVEVCDITVSEQRQAMGERLLHLHPKLDVLENNAGAKTSTDLPTDTDIDTAMKNDMALNFTTPVALTTTLLPHFRDQHQAALIYMSTGLVYLSRPSQAFYCSAKAALHAYSESLAWSLKGSSVEVYEVFLTLVDTNFHQGRLPANISAISAAEAADLSLKGIRKHKSHTHIGNAGLARWISVIAPQYGMEIVTR